MKEFNDNWVDTRIGEDCSIWREFYRGNWRMENRNGSKISDNRQRKQQKGLNRMTTRVGHRQLRTEGTGGNLGGFYRGNSADGQNRPRHPPNPDRARREAAVKDDRTMDGWMDWQLHGDHHFYHHHYHQHWKKKNQKRRKTRTSGDVGAWVAWVAVSFSCMNTKVVIQSECSANFALGWLKQQNSAVVVHSDVKSSCRS